MREEAVRPNVLFKIMTLMLFGVLIGTLAFCFMNTKTIENLVIVENDFISMRESKSYVEILFSSLLNSSALIIALFLMGFCAVAQPLELLVPIYRGMGFGAAVAQIYAANGVRGFYIAAILILPYAAVSSYGIFIAVRESVIQSNMLFGQFFISGELANPKSAARLYMVKFLVIEAVISVSAAVDCISTMVYNKLL